MTMPQISLLLVTVLALPSFAGPVRLKGGPKSEEKLRKFVEQDAKLKARLDDAAKREAAFIAEARESDLRDAVSDTSVSDLHAALERTDGEKRKALLEALPGMKPLTGPACATLEACPSPDMALEVQDASAIPGAIRRLVRPWMVLQEARGSEISLAPAEGPGDAAVAVGVPGISSKPLLLNVSPHLLGGFSVWFDHPEVSAELYAHSRQAALKN